MGRLTPTPCDSWQLIGSGPELHNSSQVIDHPVERLGQARAGEISIALLDIAHRLHPELVRQLLPV